MEEQTPTPPNPQFSLEKTLKEVIHNEHKEGKDVNWKSFKHGLQIHQAHTAWATAVSQSANSRPRAAALSRTSSARFAENDFAVAALLRQSHPKNQPLNMSLKALLADGEQYSDDEEINKDEDDDDEDLTKACCLCMVRHKGKAFVSCGHTFCRLCSKEFRVSRGNCPTCNSFVLEILDVF